MPPNEKEIICTDNGTAPGGSGTVVKTYRMATDDTAGAVMAGGYFDGIFENGLNPGDVIIASCNLSGVTPSFRILGVTVGGADVTVVDLNA